MKNPRLFTLRGGEGAGGRIKRILPVVYIGAMVILLVLNHLALRAAEDWHNAYDHLSHRCDVAADYPSR